MAFLAGIWEFLSALASSRLGWWLLAAIQFFGIQWATTEFVADPLMAQIQASFTAMGGVAVYGAKILRWLAFMNVDRYITGVMSAYASAAGASWLRMRRKP